MRTYIFTQKEVNICKDFANKVDVSYYSKRNQKNTEKNRLDQIVGKLGEIAVFNLLKKNLTNLTEPDFNIYEVKTWDADLKSQEMNIQVKTQTFEQGEKFSISWVFQKEDKIFTTNECVAFVSLDLQKKYAILRKTLPISTIVENKLLKPLKKQIHESKGCVFFDDIKHIKDLI